MRSNNVMVPIPEADLVTVQVLINPGVYATYDPSRVVQDGFLPVTETTAGDYEKFTWIPASEKSSK